MTILTSVPPSYFLSWFWLSNIFGLLLNIAFHLRFLSTALYRFTQLLGNISRLMSHRCLKFYMSNMKLIFLTFLKLVHWFVSPNMMKGKTIHLPLSSYNALFHTVQNFSSNHFPGFLYSPFFLYIKTSFTSSPSLSAQFIWELT